MDESWENKISDKNEQNSSNEINEWLGIKREPNKKNCHLCEAKTEIFISKVNICSINLWHQSFILCPFLVCLQSGSSLRPPPPHSRLRCLQLIFSFVLFSLVGCQA